MIDMHFDLLTIIYKSYLKNDYDFVLEWLKNYNPNNVTGLIANLYFMSKEEMSEEIDNKYYNDNISVFEMFDISVKVLEKIMPKETCVIYAIEGCDYIKDTTELERLYDVGLRSICLVWNEPNKYGSGIRGEDGLTKEGIEFIKKAIELGIALDLSHNNEKTFYDIIEIVKHYKLLGYEPIVYASHSNSKNLCDIKRNLTDDQLIQIKNINGYVGVMSNRNFVIKEAYKNNNSEEELRKIYLEHLIHIGNIIGYDKLLISTDDMSFYYDVDDIFVKLPIYNYKNILEELKKDLLTVFSKEDTQNILHDNASKIFSKLKKK
ncbi:MAG TPA: hypothetical protein GX747_03205 [Tenericutes bacterium]|nr:hypothetical protein [Mycoplasmatota bacterium]